MKRVPLTPLERWIKTKQDRVAPLAEFEGLRVDIREVIPETPALEGSLRSLISSTESKIVLGKSFNESEGH